MKDWIKRSALDFTDGDFPIWLSKPDRGQVQLWMNPYDMRRCEPLWDLYTHWKPAQQDFPEAPKGPTQKEKDEEAYYKSFSFRDDGRIQAWHSALAHERAEILKILNANSNIVFFNHKEAFMAIRARCTP